MSPDPAAPRGFDLDTALEAGMRLFRARGFAATFARELDPARPAAARGAEVTG